MTKNNPTVLSNSSEKVLVFSVGTVKTQYQLLLGARAISTMNHCFLIHQQLGFLSAGIKKKKVTWLTFDLLHVPGMILPTPVSGVSILFKTHIRREQPWPLLSLCFGQGSGSGIVQKSFQTRV